MPATKPKWTQLMSDCLSDFVREQGSSPYPVVDYELRMDSAKVPEDSVVWFICRTQAEKADFTSTERPRSISLFKKKMMAAGFPESAVASLEVRVTSRDEVAKTGGSYAFFR
jgi:hypothetical protein